MSDSGEDLETKIRRVADEFHKYIGPDGRVNATALVDEIRRLRDALELKDEMIQAMESVLAKIGERLKVPAGDVPALFEVIDQLTAGDNGTVPPKPECPPNILFKETDID